MSTVIAPTTQDVLERLLEKRILLLDGAMGTMIFSQGFDEEKMQGERFAGHHKTLKNFVDILCLTHPEIVTGIHRQFLDAGSDLIETNTFGSSLLGLAEFDLEPLLEEINLAACRCARNAVDEWNAVNADSPRFVAGSIGPTTKTTSISPRVEDPGYREVAFDQMVDSYSKQVAALIAGGVDLLLPETSFDTLNLKACLFAIETYFEEHGIRLPVMASVTITDAAGRTLSGQTLEAFWNSISSFPLFSVGINCALGPDLMRPYVEELSQIAPIYTSCHPNAGLPNAFGEYEETPRQMAAVIREFAENGWVNIVGGCCGTTPDHIRAIAEAVQDFPPRERPEIPHYSRFSGLEPFEIRPESNFIMVGERTNVLGSRRFRRLIGREAFEEAAEVGRRQVRNGAHILDVCLQDPDRDELDDMTQFLDLLTKKVKAPIMIDSTDHKVIELALKRLQGKSIINSVNLEDGEERFQLVIPMAQKYGAALVVGCIDEDKEQAQAVTRQRKLEIALRSAKLLTEKYHVPMEDIIFDPLVFPAGTGDKNYVGSGAETIEGVRLIKEALPQAKTVLGISNVSFGLPPAGREVLNSVFLYHCVQAGLDMAIVNSELLQRYTAIPEEERALCEDLIWYRGEDPVAAFAAHFRDKAPSAPLEERRNLPLDERLALAIIQGT
ncbi:MAG: homocysteine S-methyltransferase family protein, partial [Planctomycetes bacterium]|nr:homocysteine S-methyltransferase family protein [Planctomycetota bacterium]